MSKTPANCLRCQLVSFITLHYSYSQPTNIKAQNRFAASRTTIKRRPESTYVPDDYVLLDKQVLITFTAERLGAEGYLKLMLKGMTRSRVLVAEPEYLRILREDVKASSVSIVILG